MRIKSIYNTYIINGLPPNPICNPGEDALKAAANPAISKFYYYVSNGKGGHFFSMNLEEHNKNVKLYKSQSWNKIINYHIYFFSFKFLRKTINEKNQFIK